MIFRNTLNMDGTWFDIILAAIPRAPWHNSKINKPYNLVKYFCCTAWTSSDSKPKPIDQLGRVDLISRCWSWSKLRYFNCASIDMMSKWEGIGFYKKYCIILGLKFWLQFKAINKYFVLKCKNTFNLISIEVQALQTIIMDV